MCWDRNKNIYEQIWWDSKADGAEMRAGGRLFSSSLSCQTSESSYSRWCLDRCDFPVRFLKINTARHVAAIKILEEPTWAASIDGRVMSCKAAETTVACSQPWGHKKWAVGANHRWLDSFFFFFPTSVSGHISQSHSVNWEKPFVSQLIQLLSS